MGIFIDTCVLPRAHLEAGRIYRERFGRSLGFELLMMFDLDDFEDDLKKNLDLFSSGPLMFHEPVWGVEHTAPRGSAAWEEGMRHLRLTQKYALILRPSAMVFHLNNGQVPPGKRDIMLQNALRSLEETWDMFPDTTLLTENTGILSEGTQLIDQQEFTDLCRDRQLPVLIDVGHAHANCWDLKKLVRDLKKLIGGFHLHNNDGVRDRHNRLRDGTLDFASLIPFLEHEAPGIPRVIEYTRPAFHGEPLAEDIEYLMKLTREGGAK
ncbi:MAG: TIM barrel protein [Clostridia bacterium]|nr:TIM barrel protein [Clostridia bacterium]